MTVNPPDLASLLAFAAIFIVVAGAMSLWRKRVPGLRGLEAVRAATYLLRYGAGLEYYGLRAKEIEAHVDELRADLAAAAESGRPGLLERLGPPRTLAAEVTSHLLRPSWMRGLLWAGATAIAAMLLHILLVEAFLGAFEPRAGEGERGDWSAIGFSVEATMGDDGRATSVEFGGVWMIVAPLVAFVVGSRVWRALHLKRSRGSVPA